MIDFTGAGRCNLWPRYGERVKENEETQDGWKDEGGSWEKGDRMKETLEAIAVEQAIASFGVKMRGKEKTKVGLNAQTLAKIHT